MPLLICVPVNAYTAIPCKDKVGFNAIIDKFLPSSSVNVKVWILDASNIDYVQTLSSLTTTPNVLMDYSNTKVLSMNHLSYRAPTSMGKHHQVKRLRGMLVDFHIQYQYRMDSLLH